jgi:hypothetical protein
VIKLAKGIAMRYYHGYRGRIFCDKDAELQRKGIREARVHLVLLKLGFIMAEERSWRA